MQILVKKVVFYFQYMKKTFKRHENYGFFGQDIRLTKLTKLGDQLGQLNKGIDFEIFRVILEERLIKLGNGDGGRPPNDYVLMFKVLILQRYYNLTDEQIGEILGISINI